MGIFNRIKVLKKDAVTVNNRANKDFGYSKGNVRLSFILRTDIKTELKDFFECLKTATKEVEKELIIFGGDGGSGGERPN